MFFESLENRLCKSVSFDSATGIVTATGTGSSETISASLDGSGTLTVKITGQSDFTLANAASQVTGINVSAVGGNDIVTNYTGFNCTLDGGSGDDSLSGGTGNDSLTGVGGNDTMLGNGGNDYLNGGSGADILSGGNGNDTVDYTSYTADINVSLEGTANDGASGEGDNVSTTTENILSGSGNDSLTGNAAANLIAGGDGSDTIHGGDGNDKLIGGAGKDYAYGEGDLDLFELTDGEVDHFDFKSGEFANYDTGAVNDVII